MTSKPSFSLFSRLYFGPHDNQSSGCRPKCCYNQSGKNEINDHCFHDWSSLSRPSTRILDRCFTSLQTTPIWFGFLSWSVGPTVHTAFVILNSNELIIPDSLNVFSKSLTKQKYACLSITSLAERACVKAAWAGVVTSLIRNMVLTISLLVYRGETERNLAAKDLHSTDLLFPWRRKSKCENPEHCVSDRAVKEYSVHNLIKSHSTA